MNISTKIILNNGVEMPVSGLGVLRLKDGGEVENAVKIALGNGYRLIDTAADYHNEKGVGKGIRESGISREEIFITSKMANDQQGYEKTMKAFYRSLDWLQTDYLDLYLVHWPLGKLTLETWKAMEELYEKGLIRALGVSNFWIHHLEYFLPKFKITPAVNQVEFHPRLNQPALLKYCKKNNIQLEAWSPLMRGNAGKISVIKSIASRYNKSPEQIILRWNIQKEIIAIPRSGIEQEIVYNADIFDFSLKDNEVLEIDKLNRNKKIEPYYDRIPFLLEVLVNNRYKISLIILIIKATAHKVLNRIRRLFGKNR